MLSDRHLIVRLLFSFPTQPNPPTERIARMILTYMWDRLLSVVAHLNGLNVGLHHLQNKYDILKQASRPYQCGGGVRNDKIINFIT